MIKLFSFWRSLATYRVRIALNLKGITVDAVSRSISWGHQHHPAYRFVNPMMALPALVDGDGPVLFESLAILEYLDETRPEPPLLPERCAGAGAGARACPDRRLRFPIRWWCRGCATPRAPVQSRRVRPHGLVPSLDRGPLGGIEVHLKEPQTGTFCRGDEVTIADICLASQAPARASMASTSALIRTSPASSTRASRSMPSRGPIRCASRERRRRRSSVAA